MRMHEETARAGCAVTVSAAASVPGHFDRVRLEAVVQNLLSNAVKFGAGKPIEVRAWGEGGLAHLSVVDHGSGVRPEDRERIWGRFERAVPARHYGGLGLGLWMTRQVVEAHGGSIEVTDTPGGGATFTARLPCTPP
jgi:signal transduction histidine kinase